MNSAVLICFRFSQEKSLQSHLRGCVASAKRVVDVVGGEEIQVIDGDGDDEDKEEGEAGRGSGLLVV